MVKSGDFFIVQIGRFLGQLHRCFLFRFDHLAQIFPAPSTSAAVGFSHSRKLVREISCCELAEWISPQQHFACVHGIGKFCPHHIQSSAKLFVLRLQFLQLRVQVLFFFQQLVVSNKTSFRQSHWKHLKDLSFVRQTRRKQQERAKTKGTEHNFLTLQFETSQVGDAAATIEQRVLITDLIEHADADNNLTTKSNRWNTSSTIQS